MRAKLINSTSHHSYNANFVPFRDLYVTPWVVLRRCDRRRTATALQIASTTPNGASVPIPKFAIPCSKLPCELRNRKDTSDFFDLVPF